MRVLLRQASDGVPVLRNKQAEGSTVSPCQACATWALCQWHGHPPMGALQIHEAKSIPLLFSKMLTRLQFFILAMQNSVIWPATDWTAWEKDRGHSSQQGLARKQRLKSHHGWLLQERNVLVLFTEVL